jgi:hypothetical protein
LFWASKGIFGDTQYIVVIGFEDGKKDDLNLEATDVR